MRLLICTQKINKQDPILGFFHHWVEVFAQHAEHIMVVCLEEGEHKLPENVRVYSLGKEARQSRLQYISRFYRYISAYRDQYDAVFVHMNPEYVLLGGLLWRIWGKQIGLWYNHTYGSRSTRLATLLAHHVLHTSPYAYTAGLKKSRRMSAGIDIKLFKPIDTTARQPKSILFIGRLSPVKNVHVLLDAVKKLSDEIARDVTLDVYGSAPDRDRSYETVLRADEGVLANGARVTFHGSVPHEVTPRLYNEHAVFVNLTPRGNYDKTVLEALACGTPAIVSSEAFRDRVPEKYILNDVTSQALSEKLADVFLQPVPAASEIRIPVVKHESLEALALMLITMFDTGYGVQK